MGSIFLNGPNLASFCLFSFFSHDKYSTNLTINYKSVDGVLGTRTWGGRIVGADKSTELWRHPCEVILTTEFAIGSHPSMRIRVLRRYFSAKLTTKRIVGHNFSPIKVFFVFAYISYLVSRS